MQDATAKAMPWMAAPIPTPEKPMRHRITHSAATINPSVANIHCVKAYIRNGNSNTLFVKAQYSDALRGGITTSSRWVSICTEPRATVEGSTGGIGGADAGAR